MPVRIQQSSARTRIPPELSLVGNAEHIVYLGVFVSPSTEYCFEKTPQLL